MSSFDDLVGIGGSVCLDFVNTVDCRGTARATERLRGYAELTEWANAAAAVPRPNLDRLQDTGLTQPAVAAASLALSIEFREAIYDVLTCIAAGTWPSHGQAQKLNGMLGTILARTQIGPSPAQPLSWDGHDGDPGQIPWLVARSLVQLLESPQREQLRECAEPSCHWLFLDRTKNHSRRWCSMATCGARAKNKRYYTSRKHRT